MKTKRNIYILVVGIAALLTVALVYDTVQGSTRSYEISNEITTPEYKTDTSRVMDAYERLMNRYFDSNERNMDEIKREIKDLTEVMRSIDAEIKELSIRHEKIEKALGIEEPKPATPADKKEASKPATVPVQP